MSHRCPVCRAGRSSRLLEVERRCYWRCPECLATFLQPDQRPDRKAEKDEYDQHRNSVNDPGYRAFLAPAARALSDRVAAGGQILDYGCGPGPALAAMLTEHGYNVSLYDPIYQPDTAALGRRYDAITCTEVVEHFHHPAEEFRHLNDLLRPNGWLIVMTRFQTDDARFARWHYRRDPTHVVFYRPQTFAAVGRQLNWEVQCKPPQLALIRKLGRI